MSELDYQLYDYLINHLPAISDEWLSRRNRLDGSIYSVDADYSVEKLLREQNRLTIYTVSSVLLAEEEIFEENKENWALEVALSRVNSQTPIHEVIGAISIVREVYWEFVSRFVEVEVGKVTNKDLLKWGSIIPLAFDKLSSKFAEMYNEIMYNRLFAQQSLIEELSSPIIKITETKGVLPLIGDIDTLRAKKILDHIPEKVVEANLLYLFIDLSGVSIIDTMVAQQLLHLTQILGLLGVQSTITGIRPEIAQTSIQLGLDFSSVSTFSSLQQALKKLF